MNHRQLELVRSSYDRIRRVRPLFADLFNRRLTLIAPVLDRLLPADPAARDDLFIETMERVIAGLDRLDVLLPELAAQACALRRYGVEPVDYDVVGAALGWTVEQVLAGSPGAIAAWRETYELLSGVMKRAMAEPRLAVPGLGAAALPEPHTIPTGGRRSLRRARSGAPPARAGRRRSPRWCPRRDRARRSARPDAPPDLTLPSPARLPGTIPSGRIPWPSAGAWSRCLLMTSRVARLSILDTYGVRWSHDTFARDLLQNFFDSTADFRAIAIDVAPGEDGQGAAAWWRSAGPETFDIELLAYIGATTKTSGRTAGGFGEGFKICALIGARDFGLTITAGSGAHELAVFFDPVPLGRELCYRVTSREEAPLAGSYVRLEGCDAACIAAFQAAPAMFRHPDNPRLQQPIVVDEAAGVGVYAASDGTDGELYYRRQLRGRARFYTATEGRPITLAHDGILDELEGDRDRRDLPALPLAEAVGQKLSPEDLHRVILHLMPFWKFGNEVLSGLLSAAVARKLRYPWPARWLARSAKRPGLVEFAERQGYFIALATFAELGMPTPDQHYTSLETRPPTPRERGQFAVVRDLYGGSWWGSPASTTRFEVFSSEGRRSRGSTWATRSSPARSSSRRASTR